MSDQKIKRANGKVPLNLVPLNALKGAARVFGYGARKYAPGNWYTADDEDLCNRYAGALLRHLSDSQRPDGTFDLESLAAIDLESGLPEVDHGLCGLIILRGLLIKMGALEADPGLGNDPREHEREAEFRKAEFEADMEHRAAHGDPNAGPHPETLMQTTCPLEELRPVRYLAVPAADVMPGQGRFWFPDAAHAKAWVRANEDRPLTMHTADCWIHSGEAWAVVDLVGKYTEEESDDETDDS